MSFSAGEGRHTLTASLTLQQEPADGRGIILGQIHGADDISSVPYVMLGYQQGRLRVVVKQVQDSDDLKTTRSWTTSRSATPSITRSATTAMGT